MKAKISRGAGFRGVLGYAHKDGAERIAGSVSGHGPRDLAAEFGAVRALRPDIQKPVWHASLSLPVGERLDTEKWAQVVESLVTKLGLNGHQWLAIRHNDTDHDHVHLVANRVGPDGSIWLGQHEARRAIQATQEIESEFDLVKTVGLGQGRSDRVPSKPELERALRTGEAPARQVLQAAVNEARAGAPSMASFLQRLQVQGIEVRLNQSSTTGRVSGISFCVDGISFKGSQLGKDFTWAAIEKGLSNEQSFNSSSATEQAHRASVTGFDQWPRVSNGAGSQAVRGVVDNDSRALPGTGQVGTTNFSGPGRAGLALARATSKLQQSQSTLSERTHELGKLRAQDGEIQSKSQTSAGGVFDWVKLRRLAVEFIDRAKGLRSRPAQTGVIERDRSIAQVRGITTERER